MLCVMLVSTASDFVMLCASKYGGVWVITLPARHLKPCMLVERPG
jgi:hypothetical protein